MSDNIIWEEPKSISSATSGQQTKKLVAAMQANPGKWAVIKRYAKASSASTAMSLARNGKRSAFSEGFEFTVNKTGENEWTFYGRFTA